MDKLNSKWRLFFALEIDAVNKQFIVNECKKLRSLPNADKIRWIIDDKLHITLRFLGNMAIAHLPSIIEAVSNVLKTIPNFTLSLNSIIIFPSILSPKVIAIEISPHPYLKRLVGSIETSMVNLGINIQPQEFKPHISLGYIQGKQYPDLTHHSALNKTILLPVQRIVLFRSILNSAQSTYYPICYIPLKGGLAQENYSSPSSNSSSNR